MNTMNSKYNVGDWASYVYGQNLMIGEIMYVTFDGESCYVMHTGHQVYEYSILECRNSNIQRS